jgi:group I intron endonuclease
MYGYIYKTINLVNGKIYIGQKHSDKFLGNKYLGSGKRLKEAIAKYGKDNFTVELLEEVMNMESMDNREIYWIAHYNATNKEIGYNLSEGGRVNRTLVGENNPFYGKHHSEETRKHLVDVHRHRTVYPKHTEEYKVHMHYKMLGRKVTWGNKLSENAQINPNYGMKGKIVKEETRQKISEYHKKRWKNMSNEEHKHISENVKNCWQDEDYRRKHIEGMRNAKKRVCRRKDCEICGRSIGLNNYVRHLATHNKNK